MSYFPEKVWFRFKKNKNLSGVVWWSAVLCDVTWRAYCSLITCTAHSRRRYRPRIGTQHGVTLQDDNEKHANMLMLMCLCVACGGSCNFHCIIYTFLYAFSLWVEWAVLNSAWQCTVCVLICHFRWILANMNDECCSCFFMLLLVILKSVYSVFVSLPLWVCMSARLWWCYYKMYTVAQKFGVILICPFIFFQFKL